MYTMTTFEDLFAIELDARKTAVKTAELRRLFLAALSDVNPQSLVARWLQIHGGEKYETVIALGKSAVPMALGARTALPAGYREVVVAPRIPAGSPPSWRESSHPRLSAASVAAGQALLCAVRSSEGPVLALLSGGGSALAALPADGISWQEKDACVAEVYAAGASIEELNVVRKHLSALKGGKLAAVCSQPITTLLTSDVVGDLPSLIASGPTCTDTSTAQEALAVVARYLGGRVSSSVLTALQKSSERGHRQPIFSECTVVAPMADLSLAAGKVARRAGITEVYCIKEPFLGRSDKVAKEILLYAERPGLWIEYGESTVDLGRSPVIGRGGRAHHLALQLALAIAGNAGITILVAGSDGVDGNSGAAGAVVDGQSLGKMRRAGALPEEALAQMDSATALVAIGAQIKIGESGVNHADLVMIWVGAGES